MLRSLVGSEMCIRDSYGSLQCGAAPAPPPSGCAENLRPNGCSCDKSWECSSNWCEAGKCSDQAGEDQADNRTCTISNAVWGDPDPIGHCCPALQLHDPIYGNMSLDYSQIACCDKSEGMRGICNQAEVAAKGGVIPCLNPLNRVGFWMSEWEKLLKAETGYGFAGLVLDLESTGLDDKTLLQGLRHYLTHYLGVSNKYKLGCTVGNTFPEPNSLYQGFDFWLVEAYNLFSAMLTTDTKVCSQFLVDSLPTDNKGRCSRSCEGLLCDTVVPSCGSSIYELHHNNPRDLVGATSTDTSTFRSLLLPNVSAELQCTTSWGFGLSKFYQVAFSDARAAGRSVQEAKETARLRIQTVFNNTVLLFSTETRMHSGEAPSCIYPDNGDCGVPRAFGTWDVAQFSEFVHNQFRELEMVVTVNDDKSSVVTDSIAFSWLPDTYGGLFQFSFLPTSWLSKDQLECSE
eukprot:TRINITY_DN19608_c0_g1_i6.p1 TRINITY_DN19608_c0_g1~~TRINITY_DN19608_c0_g1_i6.p1  ORF type:complete len:458 (-),score=96.70 TRINITY_DN19608_c0_g1_i6:300-1673(-)